MIYCKTEAWISLLDLNLGFLRMLCSKWHFDVNQNQSTFMRMSLSLLINNKVLAALFCGSLVRVKIS